MYALVELQNFQYKRIIALFFDYTDAYKARHDCIMRAPSGYSFAIQAISSPSTAKEDYLRLENSLCRHLK